jgi:hypothetical protein
VDGEVIQSGGGGELSTQINGKFNDIYSADENK